MQPLLLRTTWYSTARLTTWLIKTAVIRNEVNTIYDIKGYPPPPSGEKVACAAAVRVRNANGFWKCTLRFLREGKQLGNSMGFFQWKNTYTPVLIRT